MTTLALIAFLGLVAFVLLSLFFASRAGVRRNAAQAEVEEEAATKARQWQQADADLVQQIISGVAVEKALTAYQGVISSILPTDQPERASNEQDLQVWKNRTLQQRLEEVNRRMLLPAVISCLGVVTVTVTIIVLGYNSLAAPSPKSGLDNLPAVVPSAAPVDSPADASPQPDPSLPAPAKGQTTPMSNPNP